MIPHGAFAWNELLTRDVEGAKRFHAAVLGWTYDDMPTEDGAYTVALAGGEPVGGIMAMPDEMGSDMPPHWLCYVEVDDIDRRLAGVAAAGGQVLREAFDVPGVGRIAFVQDSGGAVLGWITSEAAEA
jgi:predicted enzyme related to lactoylglutathione lyase